MGTWRHSPKPVTRGGRGAVLPGLRRLANLPGFQPFPGSLCCPLSRLLPYTITFLPKINAALRAEVRLQVRITLVASWLNEQVTAFRAAPFVVERAAMLQNPLACPSPQRGGYNLLIFEQLGRLTFPAQSISNLFAAPRICRLDALFYAAHTRCVDTCATCKLCLTPSPFIALGCYSLHLPSLSFLTVNFITYIELVSRKLKFRYPSIYRAAQQGRFMAHRIPRLLPSIPQ